MASMKLNGALLIFIGTAISATVFDNSLDESTLPVCKDLIEGVSSRKIKAPVPVSFPDLEGTWNSKRCESRPGLIFVQRTYWFSAEGKLLLQLHFYEDNFCSIPSYSVKAEGHLRIEKKSYVTPGGTEASYSFDKISIQTSSAKASKDVVRQMTKFHRCNSEKILHKLKPGNEVVLYNVPWNENNTSELIDNCCEFLSWNELQLIRVEEDLTTNGGGRKNCFRKELFLGDFHTDIRYQREYRPTAYQIPLVKDNCVSDCNGCNATNNNLSINKQQLAGKFSLEAYETIGYWVSDRCEVQRYGLFLTRILHFSEMKSSWNLKQQYYYDPNCLKPMYTILASGSVKRKNNSNIPKEIDMRILRMSIIPDEKKFAAQLNRLPRGLCGKPGKWNLGKRRDITSTGGCNPIGLLVPSKEPEIYKIENYNTTQYLYLGQTPTWPRKRNRAVQRPTTWGPALRKCRKYISPVEDNRINPVANARTALENIATKKHNMSVYINIVISIFIYLRI